jgi:hypothetical protein
MCLIQLYVVIQCWITDYSKGLYQVYLRCNEHNSRKDGPRDTRFSLLLERGQQCMSEMETEGADYTENIIIIIIILQSCCSEAFDRFVWYFIFAGLWCSDFYNGIFVVCYSDILLQVNVGVVCDVFSPSTVSCLATEHVKTVYRSPTA